MSFIEDKVAQEGITFDDVLLIPAYSEVTPDRVTLGTRFSRNITLNIPVVSAAMDTVTEAEMAIAIAREGGIGVIHKNMPIAAQAAQVRKVKRADSGMIYDPVTITKDQTVADALRLMKENRIGGIPVIDAERHLIGILTNRDLRFQKDMSLPVGEVMTSENLVTTRNADLAEASQILLENKIEKLPVVDDENRLVGLITYRDITKISEFPNACKDSKGRLRVAAGVGVTKDTLDRVAALVENGVDAVVIDTAHGHSANVVRTLKAVKEKFPQIDTSHSPKPPSSSSRPAPTASRSASAPARYAPPASWPAWACPSSRLSMTHRRPRTATACPSSPTAASAIRATSSRLSQPAATAS